MNWPGIIFEVKGGPTDKTFAPLIWAVHKRKVQQLGYPLPCLADDMKVYPQRGGGGGEGEGVST